MTSHTTTRDRALALVASTGCSFEVAALEVGVEPNTVRKWAREAGIAPPPRRRAIADERVARAEKMLRDGVTQREVAAALRLSPSTVCRIGKQMGVGQHG